MKTFQLKHSVRLARWFGLPLILSALSVTLSAAESKQGVPAKPAPKLGVKTNAPSPAVTEPPKSVFDDKLKTGKDPFFPTSARRAEKVATVPRGTNTAQAARPQ